MSVYQLYFAGMRNPAANIFDRGRQTEPQWPMLKAALENTGHYFCFILIIENQWEEWRMAEKEYKLEEYKVLQLPRFISNLNHGTDNRRLQIVVLKGKGKNEV